MQKAFVLFVNIILILGVIFLEWNVLEILLLYWIECVIIGIVYIMKGVYLKSRYNNFNFLSNFIFLPHYCAIIFGLYFCIKIFWVKDFHEDFLGPSNLEFLNEIVQYFSDPYMLSSLFLILGGYLFSFFYDFIPDFQRHQKIVKGGVFFQKAFVSIYTIYMPIILAGGIVLFCNSNSAPTLIKNLPISTEKIGLTGIIIYKIFIDLKNDQKNALI